MLHTLIALTIAISPGCYDENGHMVAPAPCHIVVNPDGSSDVYAD